MNRLPRSAAPLAALLLAACGGDSHRHQTADTGGDTPTAPRALAITGDNAPQTLAQTLFAANLLAMNLLPDINTYLVLMPVTACDNDGQASVVNEPDGARPATATYQDCRYDLGTGLSLTLDGTAKLTYDNNHADSPYRFETTGFTFTLRQSGGGATLTNRTTLAGGMTLEPLSLLPTLASVGDADLDLTFDYQSQPDGDDADRRTLNWRLTDFDEPLALDPGTGMLSLSPTGRLTLADGYLSVTTATPLLYGAAAPSCGADGSLTLSGANGSSTNLTGSGNDITLTTNGNADLLDCGDFQALTGPLNGLLIAH